MRVEYINADCVQGMHALRDAGWLFDSIVTSPPYAELRADDYGTEAIPEDEYGAFTLRWAEAALEISKPSALLALNLGFKWTEKRLSLYHGQAVGACAAAGWVLVQELVWWKENANPLIGPLVTSAHEPIYVFARDLSLMYDGSDMLRGEYTEGSLSRFTRNFHKGGVKGDTLDAPSTRDPHPLGPRAQSVRRHPAGTVKSNPHPAPMSLDLAHELVCLTTPQDGYILDPFAGSGTTALAAVRTGRNAVLIDAEMRWLNVAKERLKSSLDEPN